MTHRRGVQLILGLFLLLAVTALGFRWGLREAEDLRRQHGVDPFGSTHVMAETLRELSRTADPKEQPFLNRRRARLLNEELASRSELSEEEELDLRIRLGLELVRAGESRAAIEAFTRATPLAEKLDNKDSPFRWLLHQFLAVAHLRLAEQENCVAHHTTESCLMPIRGNGVHTRKEPARDAVRHLLDALEIHPRDLASVWLLNLAAMTLGEYPDAVPAPFRIPPKNFESEEDVGHFTDVATKVGVDVVGLSGGALVDDFTGDGLPDIVCSSWGLLDPLRFFVNDGDGGFVERTQEAGLAGVTGGLNLVHADYDNDGRLDILVLRGAWLYEEGRHPNSLLRNLGESRFADVTRSAGLLSYHPTQTAAWGDFDGDGWLDLFIGNETAAERGSIHPCELYRNNRDGTFTECAARAGVAHRAYVKGVAWGDYDGDGRPDLYLSCLGEPNVLFRNAGPPPNDEDDTAWRFVDTTARAGVAEPIESFPVWFWDYDNDDLLDLFVASYGWESAAGDVAADYLGIPSRGARPKLYRNRGDGAFEDVTESAGLSKVLITMGSNYGDLDNDGFLDVYLGTGEPSLNALVPNRMFRNVGGERFVDVTTAGGFGHLQKGHGVAFADLDGDGDQDIYAVLGGAYEGDTFQNALFENPGNENHWLIVRLEGTRSNRSAIGARVAARVRSTHGVRTVHGTVSAGSSFGGNSLEVELGLGSAEEIEDVRILWPGSGAEEHLEEVPLDAVISVREGEGTFQRVERPQTRLGRHGD